MGALDLLIPGIGTGISAISSIIGGIFEESAADKQRKQAENLRRQAMGLQPEPLQQEFRQKLNSDQLAAQSDMPGLQTAQDLLQSNMANHIRAIRESSPTGASAVNAISLALGGQNQATNQLGAENSLYKSNLGTTARNDLWNIGLQKDLLVQRRNTERDKMLAQANNLEAAATGNQQTGINTITGSIGSSAANLAGMAYQNQQTNSNQDFWKNLLNPKTTSPFANFPTYDFKGNGGNNPMVDVSSGLGLSQNNLWDTGGSQFLPPK